MDNFPLPPVQHLQPQVSESGAWRDAAPPAAAADAPSPAAQPSAPGGDPPAVEAPAAAGSGLPQPEGSAAPLACGISPLERLASSESETRLGWIQTGRPKEPPSPAEGSGLPPAAGSSSGPTAPAAEAAVAASTGPAGAAAAELQHAESPVPQASPAAPAGEDGAPAGAAAEPVDAPGTEEALQVRAARFQGSRTLRRRPRCPPCLPAHSEVSVRRGVSGFLAG